MPQIDQLLLVELRQHHYAKILRKKNKSVINLLKNHGSPRLSNSRFPFLLSTSNGTFANFEYTVGADFG